MKDLVAVAPTLQGAACAFNGCQSACAVDCVNPVPASHGASG